MEHIKVLSGIYDTSVAPEIPIISEHASSTQFTNKKAQLSLTNPRDAKACQKLLQFDVLTTIDVINVKKIIINVNKRVYSENDSKRL